MRLGTALGATASKHTDRTALIPGERTLTFREFDERSNILDHGWRAAGLRPGGRVILYVGNSLEPV